MAKRQPLRQPSPRSSVRPVRAGARGRTWPAKHRMGWRSRLILSGGAVVLVLLGWGALARHFAPASNTGQGRFDAIIVLGSPADSDGNPTPAQLANVGEAVREYEKGVAPRLILSGGAVRNRFAEAQVMAQAAHAEGIPSSAIYIEPEAQDTIHNACYSVRIMRAHGWASAEVISTPAHLPRAGLIFSRMPIAWRSHAAPPLAPDASVSAAAEAWETLKTVRYLVWARQMERCEP